MVEMKDDQQQEMEAKLQFHSRPMGIGSSSSLNSLLLILLKNNSVMSGQ